ncbi:MAG: hypothetical protein IT318_24020 [Anaerolineales bacterium]|nr:hypothetical protein [Anaerolineales bacterium]
MSIVGLVVLALVACTPSQGSIETAIAQTQIPIGQTQAAATQTEAARPTATPALSAEFVRRVNDFLEAGSVVAVQTDQGVTILELRVSVADAGGAADLLRATWPTGYPNDVQDDVADAMQGWELALDMWSLKIGEADPPVEPNVNGYLGFMTYAADELVIETYPSGCIVDEYCGKQYLPLEENTRVLMRLGSAYFDAARVGLLAMIGE